MTPARRRLAPEVIQSSALDCGPAALKSLAEGFGIRVGYGHLREACHTGVDGTSIDAVELVARHLGLDAEQVMLPADHLLLAPAHALPAVVVVRNPGGLTHFVVAWRTAAGRVQVMDPATGRRWRTARRFLADLYQHSLPVPAAAWKEWTRTGEFTGALRARLERLRLADADARVSTAGADEGWRAMAALDAAARLTTSLVAGGALKRGREAERAFRAVLDDALGRPEGEETDVIPAAYWMVRPHPRGEDGEARLLLRGAVLVRVKGLLPRDSGSSSPGAVEETLPELRRALRERPAAPARRLASLLLEDGALAPAAIGAALAASALGVAMEALLFRGLLDAAGELGAAPARAWLAGALVLLTLLLLLIDLSTTRGLRRLGRHLEALLRVAFLRKLPRLGDRYFHSRLMSDMAERAHAAHTLRALPELGGRVVRAGAELAVTTAAIAWLDRASALPAVLGAAAAVGVPLAMHRWVAERDLRVRSHQGALSRFYLDALLGLVPVRAHGAERSVRREHEMLVAEWARAGLGLFRALATAEGVTATAGYAAAAWIVLAYAGRAGASGALLLLAYWALSLPALGQSLAVLARQYPAHRNVALRLFEPLEASEEERSAEPADVPRDEPRTVSSDDRAHDASDPDGGARIGMRGVGVEASGTRLVHDLNLTIEPGAHVAIVGPSGAGKSTLVGLLLGWHRPARGEVRVDGRVLDGGELRRLRERTAWIDPAVQLWNRTAAHNLRYGAPAGPLAELGAAVDAAELRGVVRRLPEGLQTPLGEGGALVSGGEGQRVRFGRAWLRGDARLVILDEPFRGLDRARRHALLAEARRRWRGATLLCVTHDVAETAGFDRVLVVEDGMVAEDGAPADLAARADSRYARLLRAEADVRAKLGAGHGWRRLWLDGGRLLEGGRRAAIPLVGAPERPPVESAAAQSTRPRIPPDPHRPNDGADGAPVRAPRAAGR